jgi:hypothetical protein
MTDETELLALVEHRLQRHVTLWKSEFFPDGAAVKVDDIRLILSALTQERAAREAAEGERRCLRCHGTGAMDDDPEVPGAKVECDCCSGSGVSPLFDRLRLSEAKVREFKAVCDAQNETIHKHDDERDAAEAKATALEGEVERLKNQSNDWQKRGWELGEKCDRLQADIARKDAALSTFAYAADALDDCEDLIEDEDRREHVTLIFGGFTPGDLDRDDFRRARAALHPQPGEGK